MPYPALPGLAERVRLRHRNGIEATRQLLAEAAFPAALGDTGPSWCWTLMTK
ncbi:hypothetical protein MTF65_22420 [Streptomyces sp. APSN-46.1]|uniref:hypothetical protein n=1 Tax=Streptomyces sp. APSN-46.1 TaxID=2929049 RepID=UPI001FB2C5C2|nr:hypothetical protein [Streptomyces sp. APSN-46.1]MCJ1680045.1 hypothetical protein [Streptomyces sp. APSN-46.1]